MKLLKFCICVCCVVSIISCKKDYVCVCTNNNTGETSYGDHFKANVFTKKAAEESCKADGKLSAGTLDCHLE